MYGVGALGKEQDIGALALVVREYNGRTWHASKKAKAPIRFRSKG